jgi:spore maturation protein B
MILGINIFIRSGVINILFGCLHPVFYFFKIPIEIIPLALMRPISGSTSLAILNNLLQTYGPDSFIGRLASVIQGSTDTTLYVITIYFGAIGIKKIKHSLWAGLFADLIGIVTSIILVKFIFGY